MGKAHKILIGFFVVLAVIILSFYIIYFQKLNHNDNLACNPSMYSAKIINESFSKLGVVFYYGSTCPHCKVVEDFMDKNNIDAKINLTRKEVFSNKSNLPEFLSVDEYCNIPEQYKGSVPVLYTNNSCYLGSDDIICTLKILAGVK